MNERIKELTEQATTIEYGADNGFDRVTFDKEKFAELIVKECMACSTWVGKMNKTAIEPIHTAHAINQRIKQHFGIAGRD